MSNIYQTWDPRAKAFADKYEQTRDPIYAFKSFCLSRETGEPIEESVLQFLENSFRKWANAGGIVSLDEIMEIKPGKGAKSALRKTWRKERDQRLFVTIAILHELGWALPSAAEAACVQMQRQIEEKPSLERKLNPSNAGRDRDNEAVLSKNTLLDYWRERNGNRNDAINRAKTILTFGWTDEQKSEFQEEMRRLINGK